MTSSVRTRPVPAPGRAVEAVMTCDLPLRVRVEQPYRSLPKDLCRPTGRRLERRRGAVRTGSMSPEQGAAQPVSGVRSGDSNTAGRSRVATVGTPRPSAAVARRRRWVAGLLAGMVLAGLVWGLALAGGQAEQAASGTPAATEVVHVRSGETLTALAQRIAPELPASGVIDVVREMNDLSTAGLRPGQALVVPRYR